MEKTAVQWLVDELEKYEVYAKISYRCLGEIEIAKAMEKEQLCYFYIKGAEAEINNPYVTNIEFYNKKFNK